MKEMTKLIKVKINYGSALQSRKLGTNVVKLINARSK